MSSYKISELLPPSETRKVLLEAQKKGIEMCNNKLGAEAVMLIGFGQIIVELREEIQKLKAKINE
jgi:hypothetical protein